MKASRWRFIANLCLLLSVGALIAAWAEYSLCVLDVADGMTRELNPLTEQDLEKLIKKSLAGVDEPPVGFGARVGLAHPVCLATHPVGQPAMAWALFAFGLLGMLFFRNQARLASGPVRPDPEGRKRSGSVVGQRRSGRTPDEIDVGDVTVGLSDRDKRILDAVGDMNHRDESLMLYLTKDEQSEPQDDLPRDIDGFFCPPGYHDKPILYVDPAHEEASDELAGEDPVGNPERPLKTIGVALKMARELLEEDADGVMLRVAPGVYHASIDIPDGVVVVNHRLPAEGTVRARLKWLTDQSVDHPDCVTILAPPDAQYAVRFDPGVRQGLFGCHVIGRETVKQAGVVAVNSRALALVNCAIEGFIGGGIRLQDSGTELPGGAVHLHGSRLYRNESKIGGALYAERSSVNIVDCVIERNKAVTGGAIYAVDMRAPLMISNSRIAYNRAQLEESPEVMPEKTPIEAWQRAQGLGGGLYLKNSKLKVSGAEFVENGASVAGGGIAMLASKGIIEASPNNRSRFARNKSRVGAGLVLIGWGGNDATLKCTAPLVEKNKATIGGGGFAAIGLSVVQLIDGEFVENEITEGAGYGGAFVVWMGGELLAHGVQFRENQSAGHGGAIAVLNARCSLKENSRLRANIARQTGGGIYAVTTTSSVAASLIERKLVKVPFAITLEDVKISNNASTRRGGGLRGGNEVSVATPPLGFKLGPGVVFQLNRTKSQNENGDDVWIVWAGKVKATDRDRPEKIVLR